MTANSATDRIEPTLKSTHGNGVDNRPIGRILVDMGKLKPRDVDRVYALQRAKGLRFGEAACKLRLVRNSDVQQALAVHCTG
jgi:receptor protein-tyrosine kinase